MEGEIWMDIRNDRHKTVRTFLHQIALTLTVLRTQSKGALKPLPPLYGYPTHLHNKMNVEDQAGQMDQLRTAFYTYHDNTMPKKSISPPLASWLDEKISAYKSAIL